ncbi:peptide-methionine (S)-S-oxide reductase MsrA [Flavobacteriaceae bacterium F08102]|nr:peptide-methionine (S)-S-oxide reductase MsrA [Flavobacteriaceae bacterium F08102]
MLKKSILFFFLLVLLSNYSALAKTDQEKKIMLNDLNDGLQEATFGNGCFWCTEAIFQNLKGVSNVTSGYAGGHVQKPSYSLVGTGTTGHAEVIRLTFDPKLISYRELVEIFFHTHDPTTLNRQGADVGTQYRSVIFYHNDSQRKAAVDVMNQLEREGAYSNPIVTEITKVNNYFEAESNHQNYYENNKNEGYCRAVISPKLAKFIKKYSHKIEKN